MLARLRNATGPILNTFARIHAGTAKLRSLEVGSAMRPSIFHAVLILNGWVDWADGSVLGARPRRTKSSLVRHLSR